MSEAVIQSRDCCAPCSDPVTTQVPGPQGPAGINGTDGHDGHDAYTITSADFTMPAHGATVAISVNNSLWASVGEVVFIQNAGYMLVTARPGPTDLTVQNLADGTLYTTNAVPTTNIPSVSRVTAGGYQGPQGVSGLGTLNAIAPTTTKGDLMGDNGANNPNASVVRLAVGADKRILHADSSQPTGLRWLNLDLTGANTGLSGALPIANGGTGNTTRQLALNALMPTTPAQGDLGYYNGTNWTRLPKGTALQVLRTNSGATDIEWAASGAGVLQMVASSNSAYGTTTAQIPFDNTIPQSSEGTQILSVNITPTNNTSRLAIYAIIPVSASIAAATQINATIALFNGNANAIGANSEIIQNAVAGTNPINTKCSIQHTYTPGSTSTLTISVRIGNSDGATQLQLNGSGGGGIFGGVQGAKLIVVEYA